jgi:hypothetical protein
MKLTLCITLGNAEMQTPFDLGGALERVGARLCDQPGWEKPAKPDEGIVRDVNGNTVGRWKISE